MINTKYAAELKAAGVTVNLNQTTRTIVINCGSLTSAQQTMLRTALQDNLGINNIGDPVTTAGVTRMQAHFSDNPIPSAARLALLRATINNTPMPHMNDTLRQYAKKLFDKHPNVISAVPNDSGTPTFLINGSCDKALVEETRAIMIAAGLQPQQSLTNDGSAYFCVDNGTLAALFPEIVAKANQNAAPSSSRDDMQPLRQSLIDMQFVQQTTDDAFLCRTATLISTKHLPPQAAKDLTDTLHRLNFQDVRADAAGRIVVGHGSRSQFQDFLTGEAAPPPPSPTAAHTPQAVPEEQPKPPAKFAMPNPGGRKKHEQQLAL